MGQNLATLLAPEGVTVNIVSSSSHLSNSVKLTVYVGLASYDWLNGHDPTAHLRVRSSR